MKIKVGDTLDLIGYKNKRTPIQVVSMSSVGDHGKEAVVVFTYLDNSGRPNGTCRVKELAEREQEIKKETSKKEDHYETNDPDNRFGRLNKSK